MTKDFNENLYNDFKNRRKAYAGMCFATLLLFAFSMLSSGVSYFVQRFLYYDTSLLERYITALISFFGVGKATAVSSARQLILSGAFGETVNMLVSVVTMLLPVMLFSKISCPESQ